MAASPITRQAIVQSGIGDEVHITLYCDQQEYSQLEYGDQLYAVVARQILGQRRSAGRYRCYITDLDLSELLADEQGSTCLHLRYKRELEQALNDGVEQLQASLQ